MSQILAISSHVARGYVGLAAIVPALQAFGHEVIALPTVLLSNHPGHAHVAGERVAPAQLWRMFDALDANGWLGGVDAVLTGYLPSVEHVAFARDVVERVRVLSERAIYLCDPVIGDTPKGVYIDAAAAAAIRDDLVPIASLAKMNAFEAGWLTGMPVGSEEDAVAAAMQFRKEPTVITSVPVGDDTLSNVIVGLDGDAGHAVRVARLERVPNGTGDLLSALLLGSFLRAGEDWTTCLARAVAGVELIAKASWRSDELQLVAHLAGLADCAPLATIEIT